MLSIEDALALSFLSRNDRVAAQDYLRSHPGSGMTQALPVDLTGVTADALAGQLRQQARRVLDAGWPPGIAAVPWQSGAYPPLLASIPDAPFVLWVRGRLDSAKPSVAIVGSRAATPYGLEAASRLAGDLAAAGVVIVSGLARGIDSAAHQAALAAGGETVAVLGSGPDVIYPAEHARLATQVAAAGALVSELRPGTPPLSRHFPARNRIISGLAAAVVVVEAAERSGSLITAGCALEQGRAVMAVPGSVLSGRYRGCHGLIRDGAAMVESAEDVLAELQTSFLPIWSGDGAGRAANPGPSAGGTAALQAVDPILDIMLPGESYDVASLGLETGLSPPRLLARLLELELCGRVKRLDGGWFVRAGRTC